MESYVTWPTIWRCRGRLNSSSPTLPSTIYQISNIVLGTDVGSKCLRERWNAKRHLNLTLSRSICIFERKSDLSEAHLNKENHRDIDYWSIKRIILYDNTNSHYEKSHTPKFDKFLTMRTTFKRLYPETSHQKKHWIDIISCNRSNLVLNAQHWSHYVWCTFCRQLGL